MLLPPAAQEALTALRRRADEDFLEPPAEHVPGRHQLDVAELGLRVSITRARYPNRPDGRDLYAVTVARATPGEPPLDRDTRELLAAAFGAAAERAEARPGGSAVRMFRIPAGAE